MKRERKHVVRSAFKKIYRNGSMKTQFILVYFLCVMVPTVIAMMLMSHTMNRKLQDIALQTEEDMVSQICSNVSFQFQQMANISLTISTNRTVRENLSHQPADVYEAYSDSQEIQKIVNEIITISPNLKTRFYVDADKSYSRQGVYFYDLEEFFEAHDVNEGGYLLPQQSWTYRESGPGDLPTVSYACPVYSVSDITRVIAYLEVDMDYSDFEELLTGTFLSDSSGYSVVDSSGRFLRSEWEGDVPFTGEDFTQKEGVLRKGDEYYAYAQINPSQWYLVYPVNFKAMSQNATYSFLTVSVIVVILFAVFFLVLVLVMLLIVTTHYDSRIQSITASLATYDDLNDLEPNLRKRANNMDRLTLSVNRLILKVKGMTEQSAQAEIKEKNAELKAMQFQINPHFLYNALDSINWAAIKRGDTVTSRQVSLLARYFRLVLSTGDSSVHLSEELEFCRVYLQIQEEIYVDKFTFKIDFSGLRRDVILPKMTIQPVVENALIHGVLKLCDKRGEISVSVEQTDTATTVSVRDNGVGFDADKMGDAISRGGQESFGLRNVYERLRLFLEADPAFAFRSDESGSEVRISMKL